MEIKNFADLQEKIFRKGLPKELAAEVQAGADKGQTDITVQHMTEIDQDQAGFRVHCRYDPETQMAYLNKIDAAIFKSPDFTGMREHTFHDYQLITAMEAYRLLKYGELVAVNKTLYNKAGEQYNTWISLDLNGAKDEKGNYPLKSYHQNYYGKEPYSVRDAFSKLQTPIKELGTPETLDNLEKLVKKGILPVVTILHNGQEQKGYLSIDPGNAGAKLFDANRNLVEAYARPRPEQKESHAKTEKTAKEPDQQGQNDVKKKSWNQSQNRGQAVTWNKQKSKGQSW